MLPAGPAERPLIFNSWEATEFDITEQQQTELAAGLGVEVFVEVFVVDDAWFGTRTSDMAGLGEWWPNPDRFPDGLGPLADHVRALGMGFGLWVEPEAVNPDSDLFRAHPDWNLCQDGRTRTQRRSQHVLDFARRDVREWAVEWLVRTVTELDVVFLAWDMNRPFSEAGQPGAADPDPVWIGHTRGAYEVMDQPRAARPGLYVESCAGGGSRADLGVLAYADQVWTSDIDAADRVAIQHGHCQPLPARTMGAWVTDSPNSFTARPTSVRYRFHVSMTGAMGIGDLRNWSEEELAWSRILVEQYKRIRPVVHGGIQYCLEHHAVRYLTEDEVIVFRFQPSAPARTAARTRLKGSTPTPATGTRPSCVPTMRRDAVAGVVRLPGIAGQLGTALTTSSTIGSGGRSGVWGLRIQGGGGSRRGASVTDDNAGGGGPRHRDAAANRERGR
ncbi:glycoside hydrolase family 36 protein [Streptomyces sp. NPDC002164]|uniref:glycoside hydrolase family 36 protein n=1 Tax=Streptomyces sp. NPDC002164 TaxID=3364633 RepID=UPI00368018CE